MRGGRKGGQRVDGITKVRVRLDGFVKLTRSLCFVRTFEEVIRVLSQLKRKESRKTKTRAYLGRGGAKELFEHSDLLVTARFDGLLFEVTKYQLIRSGLEGVFEEVTRLNNEPNHICAMEGRIDCAKEMGVLLISLLAVHSEPKEIR